MSTCQPPEMPETIVVSLGSPSLLSLSTNPPKRVHLPLTSPSALQKSLLTHLQPSKATRIIVAEPPISFPPSAREAIKHVARRRHLRVTFHDPFRCINAVLSCVLVLDVTRPLCVVYDACHVDVGESVDDVLTCVSSFVERYDRFTKAELRIAVVGERPQFVREIRDMWPAGGQGVKLSFVKCVFDCSVLVWVGAAVLAGCSFEGDESADGDAIT